MNISLQFSNIENGLLLLTTGKLTSFYDAASLQEIAQIQTRFSSMFIAPRTCEAFGFSPQLRRILPMGRMHIWDQEKELEEIDKLVLSALNI